MEIYQDRSLAEPPMNPNEQEQFELPELEELELDEYDDHEPFEESLLPEKMNILDLTQPLYVPPLNFSVVEDGIYRSGHPIEINFNFLSRLNLKTIIYLGDKEDQFPYYSWISQQDINFRYIKTSSAQEPFKMNDPNLFIEALKLMVDYRNFPILIHSNKGKHRVGVLVGVMRKSLQGWSLSGIFDEYVKFAGGKEEADLEFMELFEPCLMNVNVSYMPSFVRLK